MYWVHTPHYSIDITWCTLLIIPSNLHHAHSSLFCRKCLSIYMIHTLLGMNKDFDCTLLVNLLDAHSSLFHRHYMMDTPHYSIKFTSCTLLIILQKVPGYKQELHTPANAPTSTFSMHSPGKFTGCTLLIIPWNSHDTHSSLFHQIYIMHTPHYSAEIGWVYTWFTHSCLWRNTLTALSW